MGVLDKLAFWRLLGYRRQLKKEEKELKAIWDDLLKYIRRDLANIWSDEVTRDIRIIKTELERLRLIFKRLHTHYTSNEALYQQKIAHLNLLLAHLEKV